MEVPSYEFDVLIENKARKKYSCPICHEIIIITYKTTCNHRFCKFCITKWKMYFEDCPVCRKKLISIAPHPRTDKWIQQLYDLATTELRQDREMCINYRKLQQIKMELIGKEDLNLKINSEGFPVNADDASSVGKTQGSSVGSKPLSILSARTNLGKSTLDANEPEEVVLFMKNSYSDVEEKPSVSQFGKAFPPSRDSHDVTLLFGTPSPTNLSDGSSRSSFQIRSNPELDAMQDPLVTEDSFPKGINSAHTFCLHYPKDNACQSLTLAELTCDEDDTGIKSDENLNEGQNERTIKSVGDGDFFDSSKVEFLDTKAGSDLAKSLNVLKAETMCARIQHQIAMAALPNVNKPAQLSSSKTSILSGKQPNEREKQDLQSCREALLSLRLRLLPLTKATATTLKEKRVQSEGNFVGQNMEAELDNSIEQKEKYLTHPDIPKIKQNLLPLPKKCQSIQDCNKKK